MSLSVSADKQAKLDAIAANAKRSRSYIVNEAIDHYLDLYEWQTRGIEERLARTQSGNARWMPDFLLSFRKDSIPRREIPARDPDAASHTRWRQVRNASD